MKMIEEYQSIPTLEAEEQKEHDILVQMQQEWEAIEAKHRAERWPHDCRVAQIRHRLSELGRHEQLLRDGCRCEALIVGRDNINFQRSKICDEQRQIENRLHRLRFDMHQAQCVIDEKSIYLNSELKKQEAKQVVLDNQREIEKLQKQIEKLDQKIAEYDSEIARIEAEMVLE